MDHRSVKVVIMGAGGRDFHNFNVVFRDNPRYKVLAFTATQIPGIVGRRYPPELAGSLYPSGIPIVPEEMLEYYVSKWGVDVVVLSYSDLTYQELGERVSRALASGASFMILGPRDTMLPSTKPVIAVTAVKTGAGKSSVSRAIIRELRGRGLVAIPIRHPMAYGDPSRMAVQRFSTLEDLDKYGVTVEEREEYEHYIANGLVVYAGIDYGRILAEAEKEADIILWDGGNNDWPFIEPDYMIAVADALRPGLEVSAFPGEVNARMADHIIINKVDQAPRSNVDKVLENIRRINPRAEVSLAASRVRVDNPDMIKGKRVAIVEDSPTVTHGGAPYGAGMVAARQYGAGEIVDPKPYAVGIIRRMMEEYPHMDRVVPSTGYTPSQIKDLEETLRKMPVDVIVSGTPIDLSRIVDADKPIVRVWYDIEIVEGPSISEIVDRFLDRAKHKMG